MQNLRIALQNATNRKLIPVFKIGIMCGLSLKLNLSIPFSLLNLIKTLNKLNPARVIYEPGPLTAKFVYGSEPTYIQRVGSMSFNGQVHESGFVE
jgi:hypothetical protein